MAVSCLPDCGSAALAPLAISGNHVVAARISTVLRGAHYTFCLLHPHALDVSEEDSGPTWSAYSFSKSRCASHEPDIARSLTLRLWQMLAELKDLVEKGGWFLVGGE